MKRHGVPIFLRYPIWIVKFMISKVIMYAHHKKKGLQCGKNSRSTLIKLDSNTIMKVEIALQDLSHQLDNPNKTWFNNLS